MVTLLIKFILLLAFGTILYQDIRERQVYWILFPIVAICVGILYYDATLPELFLSTAIINLTSIIILCFGIYLYAKFKLNTSLSNVIGIGDLLFLFGISLGFSSVSFLVLLPCAFIFSLCVHLLLKSEKYSSVPLAGYLSLFFGITFLGYWSGIIQSLYQF